MFILILSIIYNKTYLTSPPNKSQKYANLYILYVEIQVCWPGVYILLWPSTDAYNNDNKQSVAYTILQVYNRVKCTKYETCAYFVHFPRV